MVQAAHAAHPADCYPELFPHTLPPMAQHLPALVQCLAEQLAQGLLPVPQLVSAAEAALAEEAAAAAADAAAADAAMAEAAEEVAAAPLPEWAALLDTVSSSDYSGASSHTCGDPDCCYCHMPVPSSSRVAPGRKITWRGAINGSGALPGKPAGCVE